MICCIIVHKNYLNKKARQNYSIFHQAHLDGEIEAIRAGLGRVYFSLKNDPQEYAFHPKINTNQQTFTQLAEKGDRIFKAKESKIIQLFKGQKTYKFTFHHF